MSLIAIFLLAFVVAVLVSPVVGWFAIRWDVLDRPSIARKLHREAMPLLGGIAVAVAIFVAAIEAYVVGWLPGEHLAPKHLVGLAIAVLILVIGGALDDRYNLKPREQIVWPILAALAIIASGIGINVVTNPFGGVIRLDAIVIPVLTWKGIPYKLTLLADLFTMAWLLGMTYTTKFLDGLDGLVSGVTGIGAIVIACVSLLRDVSQPDTALIAMIVAGAFFGFLIFNFHPARMFLGEGGSTLAGFALGTLAIVSGGKIATTLLVLGLPIMDAAFVIVRRIVRRRSPTTGDRTHLHHRLLDLGLSHRQTVLFFYFIAALFGTSTVFLQKWEKVLALGVMLAILALFAVMGLLLSKRAEREPSSPAAPPTMTEEPPRNV